MKKLIFVFLFWLASMTLSAQDVDSLWALLPQLSGKAKVDILIEIGDYSGESRKAEYEEALLLAESIGYDRGVANAHASLGRYYSYLDDEEKTEHHLLAAKEIFEKLDCRCVEYLDVLDGMSIGKSIAGDYEEAIKYAIKMLELGDEYDIVPNMIHADLQLAQLYRYIYYPEKAYVHLSRAMELALKHPEFDIVAEVEYAFANYFSDENQLDSSMYYFQAALANMENTDEWEYKTYYIPDVYGSIAEIHLRIGEPEQAIALAEKNLKRIEKINKEEGVSNEVVATYDRLTIGRAYLKLNQYEKAEQYAEAALITITQLGYHDMIEEVHSILRETAKAKGDFSDFFYHNEKYEAYHDSLTSAERTQQVAGLKARYDFEKQEQLNTMLTERNDLLKNVNLWTTIVAGGLMLIAAVMTYLFYKIRRQKHTIELQNEQLANLNATKDQLFAIIAHDMRNAVYNFRGVTDKIHYFIKKKQPERIDEFGDQIEMSVNNLTGLMNNLLNWALTQKGAIPYQPKNIEVKKIMEHVFKNFTERAERKNVDLKVNVQENISVYADWNALSTILRNLLGNSLKYTKNGKVGISSEQKNGRVKISVKDEGVGMNEAQLKNLFKIEKNKTRRGTFGEKGSGIGMVLVKELVEMNKGEIYVESELGKGTCVSIILPKKNEV